MRDFSLVSTYCLHTSRARARIIISEAVQPVVLDYAHVFARSRFVAKLDAVCPLNYPALKCKPTLAFIAIDRRLCVLHLEMESSYIEPYIRIGALEYAWIGTRFVK